MAPPDLSGYVTVPERIAQFREKHPEGSLQPVDFEEPFRIVTVGDKTFIAYAAAAYRDPGDKRPGIGVAWEAFPGRTPYTKDSELMNAETSAWGRAIVAVLAADTNSGIATAEEIRNRRDEEGVKPPVVTVRSGARGGKIVQPGYATPQELVAAAHAAKTPEEVREHYKTAGTKGWLKSPAAHPETGDKLIVEDFLTAKGNDLKHKSGAGAAADDVPGKPGAK